MEHKVYLYELAMGRVLDYLVQCNVEVTPAIMRSVLQTIECALAQGEEGLLQRVLDELPDHIVSAPGPVPAAMPPIHRSHIGYG